MVACSRWSDSRVLRSDGGELNGCEGNLGFKKREIKFRGPSQDCQLKIQKLSIGALWWTIKKLNLGLDTLAPLFSKYMKKSTSSTEKRRSLNVSWPFMMLLFVPLSWINDKFEAYRSTDKCSSSHTLLIFFERAPRNMAWAPNFFPKNFLRQQPWVSSIFYLLLIRILA